MEKKDIRAEWLYSERSSLRFAPSVVLSVAMVAAAYVLAAYFGH